jgi:hypothetical protein
MCLPKFDKIKNIDLPSCRNCVHFISGTTVYYGRCKKFGVKDVITNEIDFNMASSCRNDENTCGIVGKHFQQISPTQKFTREVFIYWKENSLFIFYLLVYLVGYRFYQGFLLEYEFYKKQYKENSITII